MGEAGRRRRKHEAILRNGAVCIYCGGKSPATTVEHMPPRIIFRGKQRPKGLEFPACAGCNNGSSHADLVAGLLSRTYGPDDSTDRQEVQNILRAISTNIPGLLQEMHIDEREQRLRLKQLPMEEAGGLLKVGPMTAHFMRAFSLKIGAALHFETTNLVVPEAGGLTTRWFSNYERITDKFPDSIFDLLLPPQTLRQGRKEVSDQFQYAWRHTDDLSMGLYFASFRFGFAVITGVATEKSKLEVHGADVDQERVFTPGQLGRLLRGD